MLRLLDEGKGWRGERAPRSRSVTSRREKTRWSKSSSRCGLNHRCMVLSPATDFVRREAKGRETRDGSARKRRLPCGRGFRSRVEIVEENAKSRSKWLASDRLLKGVKGVSGAFCQREPRGWESESYFGKEERKNRNENKNVKRRKRGKGEREEEVSAAIESSRERDGMGSALFGLLPLFQGHESRCPTETGNVECFQRRAGGAEKEWVKWHVSFY